MDPNVSFSELQHLHNVGTPNFVYSYFMKFRIFCNFRECSVYILSREEVIEMRKLTCTVRTASFSKESAVKYAFTARGRGILLIMPRPFLGCQIKAEIKGFFLMYRLFRYYLWFFQNIEEGWRKNIFNFRHFEKSRK
jgi:hypothetical protein